MLALAPDRVRMELIARADEPGAPEAVQALILDRGATWPWRSDDPRLARGGIIGDAHGASAELGAAIVDRVVAQSEHIFRRLLENQQLMSGGRKPPG